MNPGLLRERIEILSFKKRRYSYFWDSIITVWANVEQNNKTNLFSKVGVGEKTVKFIIRKRDLTLHNAFEWQNRHCFLTDIREIDRSYLEVIAAQIEPTICSLTRNVLLKNELNRPVLKPKRICSFPACMVEKYLGFQQQIPQAINTMTYVLVTPKAIELLVGDLVKIGDNVYNVQIIHNLDEYKNEYEISVVKEA